MATASPTPIGQGSQFTSLGRRTSARQAVRRPPSRPQLARAGSNPGPSGLATREATPEMQSQSQPEAFSTLNDSSDDEIPVPMKLSALTKAILGGGTSVSTEPAPGDQAMAPMMTRRRSMLSKSTSSATAESEAMGQNGRQTRRHIRSGSAAQVLPSSRETSPVPRRRVVRLSTTPAGGGLQNHIRRSLSASKHGKQPLSRTDEKDPGPGNDVEPSDAVNTPADSIRKVQIAVGSSGNRARLSSSSVPASKPPSSANFQSDYDPPEEPAGSSQPQGSASRLGTGERGRETEAALQSAMRVKRVAKIPGSFLSGPARRGKRRQSEEEENGENGEVELPASNGQRRTADAAPATDAYAPYVPDYASSGSPVRASLRKQAATGADIGSGAGLQADAKKDVHRQLDLIPPTSRPHLPATHDQENEGLQNHKRMSPPAMAEMAPPPKGVPSALRASAAASPERKALQPISRNTPHRPAPPPPKMTVLETATATAGAATASQASRKQRVLMKVNRPFLPAGRLHRTGGSGKVYRVTAENGNMFALKRVSVENADQSTIRGYMGEIDLLTRLQKVDRVIQLFDHEMNDEKHTLSLLMEMGELDLNSLLKARQSPEGSTLDVVFVRYYWKEMLECLQAVHAHDIVHSDLKPANFVLVRGRLKLIDFGIANAIQTDETVNVHRETQVGTPNYMSPESLMDSQQYAFTAANNGRLNLPQGPKGARIMKLGKPSDVWSLGCILYQIVYGQLPFGHIQNQMARCHAIINWDHAIDFPARGMGGVLVPWSLLKTMRACLSREQSQRPTCQDLLSEADPFLYPQEHASALRDALPITEELLGSIIQSVIKKCRERMPTDGEAASTWPVGYWASVKKTVEARDRRP